MVTQTTVNTVVVLEPEVVGYAYRLGMHYARNENGVWRCSCGDLDCPSVMNVAVWIASAPAWKLAPTPPTGYFAFVPGSCPICGAPAVAKLKLSTRWRGVGWECSEFGEAHYWRSLKPQQNRCECGAYPIPHARGLGRCGNKPEEACRDFPIMARA